MPKGKTLHSGSKEEEKQGYTKMSLKEKYLVKQLGRSKQKFPNIGGTMKTTN